MLWNLTLRRADNSTYILKYDTEKNIITNEEGETVCYNPSTEVAKFWTELGGVAVRINMGKACNFKCSYCSQANSRCEEKPWKQKRSPEEITEQLIKFCAPLGGITHVQFWGGEPLLFFDEMKRFHSCFMEKMKDNPPSFFFSTNGKLLRGERFKWAMDNDIHVNLSWDGSGQFLRGEDILLDPEVVKNVQYILDTRPEKFNLAPVMTWAAKSQEDVVELAKQRLGRDNFTLSESTLVMVEGPEAMSAAMPVEDLPEYGMKLHQALIYGRLPQFSLAQRTAIRFLKSLGTPLTPDTTRCFVSSRFTLTVDMEGNIQACQNFNADTVHDSGDPIKQGNIFVDTTMPPPKLSGLKDRRERRCKDCLVVGVCKGGCPYMSKKYEEYNCAANFWQYMPIFGYALAIMTGHSLKNWSPAS